MFCKSGRESYDIYNQELKEIESLSNVSDLHMRLNIANQQNLEAEKKLQDFQSFVLDLDLNKKEEFQKFIKFFQKPEPKVVQDLEKGIEMVEPIQFSVDNTGEIIN